MIINFSVLIPVYNFNVFPLVEQLDKIAQKSDVDYEILLIDDCSSNTFKEKNKIVSTFRNVKYHELNKNIGRSKIRNLLFEKAKYEHCVVLDCDVLLAKESFLDEYLGDLENYNVIVGGHIYLPKPPKDKSKYFHWLYGRKIEAKPFGDRMVNEYSSFMTSSFAITKTLFNTLKFNEKISDYGHEDTLFGFELKRKKIPVVHINNPVVHLGIEKESVFLEKQEKAIVNLIRLYKKGDYKKEMEENIKLIKFYNLFYNKFPYSILIFMIYNFVKILNKVTNFDFVKLSWFNLWKLEKYNYYTKNL